MQLCQPLVKPDFNNSESPTRTTLTVKECIVNFFFTVVVFFFACAKCAFAIGTWLEMVLDSVGPSPVSLGIIGRLIIGGNIGNRRVRATQVIV